MKCCAVETTTDENPNRIYKNKINEGVDQSRFLFNRNAKFRSWTPLGINIGHSLSLLSELKIDFGKKYIWRIYCKPRQVGKMNEQRRGRFISQDWWYEEASNKSSLIISLVFGLFCGIWNYLIRPEVSVQTQIKFRNLIVAFQDDVVQLFISRC